MLLKDVLQKLEEIEKDIHSQITNELKSQGPLSEEDIEFLSWLDRYLIRLIEKDSVASPSQQMSVRATRQLLCCIAIDLKHKNVTVDHYLKIFRAVQKKYGDDTKLEARHMFRATIVDETLFYKEVKHKEQEEAIMVFPIRDLGYYYHSTSSISGRDFKEAEKELDFRELKGKVLELQSSKFDKGKDHLHFWITTRSELNSMIKRAKSKHDETNQVIDLLGLSHFDIKQKGLGDYFYIDLGSISFESIKPNATIIDWDCYTTGFLSCYKKQSVGHTFSITGFKNFFGGVEEKIFTKLQLNGKEQKQCKIVVFDSSAVPPLEAHIQDIIEEGINRWQEP